MDSLFDSQNPIPNGIPLSQYTEAISRTVSMSPHLAGVWVSAELSDVRVNGGHCYLELIEKNAVGQTIAKLKANIWRTTFQQLRQKFYRATQRDITTGIKALVRGSATHHSIYGLAFNIIDIDPSYTLGDMERLRREILMRLNQEGVLNRNKGLSLPIAPQRIALISAQGAAGYGDFINHLKGNAEGFVFYPFLFPCLMQGDRVSESIRKALKYIESTAQFWDCVAIVRGGGATTDLNGFDDYQLARAVATCPLPVIVGIGHERDRNVLDDIAHTSLKTPTAVAGFFIDRLRGAYDNVLSLTDKIRAYSTEMLRGEERHLSALQSLVPQLALRRLEEAKSSLNSISGKLPLLTQGRIINEQNKLEGLKNLVGNFAGNRIDKENIRLNNTLSFVGSLLSNLISRSRQKIENLESLVMVLDPKNTIKRGYSITRINGKAVKSVNEVHHGDILTTMLDDGEIRSQALVEDIEN